MTTGNTVSKWDYARNRPSLYALIAANLLPLVGLAFLGSSGESILALYFFEAVVIYLTTALMLARVAAEENRPLVGSYLFRYGLGLVLMAAVWMGMFGSRFQTSSLLSDHGLHLSAIAILIWHAFSYVHDFVGGREYSRLPWKIVEGRMLAVYLVLFTVPLALILFAFWMPPTLVAAVLVLVKTYVAAGAYAAERARAIEHGDELERSVDHPIASCPNCGKPLRTAQAKQCPHCFASWHDAKPPNPAMQPTGQKSARS